MNYIYKNIRENHQYKQIQDNQGFFIYFMNERLKVGDFSTVVPDFYINPDGKLTCTYNQEGFYGEQEVIVDMKQDTFHVTPEATRLFTAYALEEINHFIQFALNEYQEVCKRIGCYVNCETMDIQESNKIADRFTYLQWNGNISSLHDLDEESIQNVLYTLLTQEKSSFRDSIMRVGYDKHDKQLDICLNGPMKNEYGCHALFNLGKDCLTLVKADGEYFKRLSKKIEEYLNKQKTPITIEQLDVVGVPYYEK